MPSLVVGPWVKPGYVSHEQYDHTSIIAFLSMLFEVEGLTRRDKAASPLLDCFNEEAMRSDAPLSPIQIPTIYATDEELYAPECAWLPNFMTSDGRSVQATGQPALERYIDENGLKGTRLDRREQAPEIYEELLARAIELGVLKRL